MGFMLFRNILVPYDDSKCSLHAVKVAVNIAKKYNSKVTVATCIPVFYTGKWYEDHKYMEAVSKKRKETALETLKRVQDLGGKSKIAINVHVFEAESIVKGIVSFAKTHKIDLIVMGTSGRTNISRLVLGSVANGVTQNVHCPVLLIR
jgi:nucleotide-binding universal stress UspA family protein